MYNTNQIHSCSISNETIAFRSAIPFCLQTPLSDLKMIGVSTSKIIFHLRNLSRARSQINLNDMAGDPNEACIYVLLLIITVLCAYSLRPTKEQIAAKTEIACTQQALRPFPFLPVCARQRRLVAPRGRRRILLLK